MKSTGKALLYRYPSTSQVVENQAAAGIPLAIKGHASQSGDYFVVENSAGTDLFVVDSNGYVGIGTAINPSNNRLIVSHSHTELSGNNYAVATWGSASPASASVATYHGIIGSMQTSAGDHIDNRIVGVIGLGQNDSSSGTINEANGVAGSINQTTAGGTILYAAGLKSSTPYIPAGSISNIYGLWVQNQGATGVTNAYGLYISPQSGASTKNIGAYIASTVGIGAEPSTDQLFITNQTASNYALRLRGHASQSADIFVVEASDGTDLLTVNPTGALDVVSSTLDTGIAVSGSARPRITLDSGDTVKTRVFKRQSSWYDGGISVNANWVSGSTWDLDSTSYGGWVFSMDANGDTTLRRLPSGASPSTAVEVFRVLGSNGEMYIKSRGLGAQRFTADAVGAFVAFYKSRSATVDVHSVVQADDALYTIDSYGSDGSAWRIASRIGTYVDGTPGASDMPGRIIFSTTADGAASVTERMRIDSSGRVGIGVTPTSPLHVVATSTETASAVTPGLLLSYTASPASASASHFQGVRALLTTAAGDNVDGTMYALSAIATNASSSGTVPSLYGIGGAVVASAGGTTTLGTSIVASAPSLSGGGAITTMRGVLVENHGATGVTNAYGLVVAAQSGAATKNIGAYINGNVGIGVDPTSDSNAILELSKGINFPDTAVASTDVNTLDDYEEGTFTPALTFDTAGDLSVTYSEQAGRYVKVGKVVHYAVALQTSAFTHTTASGGMRVTGLPFTSAAVAFGGPATVYGWTAAGYGAANMVAQASQSYLVCMMTGSGQWFTWGGVAHFLTGAVVRVFVSGHYEV